MNLADFYLMTVTGLVTAGALGFVLGRRIGRNEERVWQAVRRIRRRRPLQVNVDYDFASRAFRNAGYEVRQLPKELH